MNNKEKQDKAASNFLQAVYAVHQDKLLVLDSYSNNLTKVNVLCNTCSNIWSITPNNLKRGRGCPSCANVSRGNIRSEKARLTLSEDIERIHNGRIELRSEYIDDSSKIDCYCTVCGNLWSAQVSSLKQGHGCKVCYNFKNRRALAIPTKIYYVHFPKLDVWKIGCTIESITRRFRQEKAEMQIVYYEELISGVDAYRLEGYLLRQFKDFKYRGPNVLKSGNTELITKEVNFKEALQQAKIELGITNVSK